MRILAGVLVVITLLVGGFLIYCNWGAQMQIEGAAATTASAIDAMEIYDEVRAQLADGTFLGQQYKETEFLMADGFEFLTITVRMANRGIFPMEWLRIEVVPDSADILQLAADRAPTLASNSRADFTTTILTRTGASTAREVTVTYYVLGQKMSATYSMHGQ